MACSAREVHLFSSLQGAVACGDLPLQRLPHIRHPPYRSSTFASDNIILAMPEYCGCRKQLLPLCWRAQEHRVRHPLPLSYGSCQLPPNCPTVKHDFGAEMSRVLRLQWTAHGVSRPPKPTPMQRHRPKKRESIKPTKCPRTHSCALRHPIIAGSLGIGPSCLPDILLHWSQRTQKWELGALLRPRVETLRPMLSTVIIGAEAARSGLCSKGP